uniref:Uncharacterized protein n=1 Tax=Arundo donax TaxID=35708 RepID=A0A0A9H4T5_ARUDO
MKLDITLNNKPAYTHRNCRLESCNSSLFQNSKDDNDNGRPLLKFKKVYPLFCHCSYPQPFPKSFSSNDLVKFLVSTPQNIQKQNLRNSIYS